MATAERLLTRIYRTNFDFIFAATRDFVRIARHPYGCYRTTLRRVLCRPLP